jgi:hypothetical protein
VKGGNMRGNYLQYFFQKEKPMAKQDQQTQTDESGYNQSGNTENQDDSQSRNSGSMGSGYDDEMDEEDFE